MNNNITPELLEKYLDNELEEQERTTVETALSDDTSAKELLERLLVARQAYKQYAIKEQVTAIHAQEIEEHEGDEKKPAVKVHWLRQMIQVAALLLVLLAVAGLVQYSLLDADQLYRSHYGAYASGTASNNIPVSELEKAYRANNMQKVAALYEGAITLSPADHFFAGQAFLATGNAGKAVRAFEAQLTQNAAQTFKPYQDDAEYYLALALLKADNIKRAFPLFEKIHSNVSHTYHLYIGNWYLTQLRWLQRKKAD